MGLLDRLLAPFRTTAGAIRSDMPPANLPDAELTRSQRYEGESRMLARVDDDPAMIGRIFGAASRMIADQVQLADEIEQYDDHINGTLELRRSAVTRLQTTVKPGDDSSAAGDAAEAARTLVDAPWFRVAADNLLRSVFTQWAANEVIWQADGLAWNPIGVREVEPSRWWLSTDGRPHFYRCLSRRIESDVVPAIAGKYMLMGAGISSMPGARAKVRAVAKLWYLSRCDMTAWGTMIDQWGIPVVKISYPEGMAEGDLQTMVEKIWELAGRRIIAHKAGTTVETEEVPDQSPHESFQVFYRRAVSRLLLGQDSSQMAIDGQKTGATLQGNVRDDVRDRDAALLADALNETFFAPWCAWNFGPNVAAPQIKYTVRETRDPVQRVTVFKGARELGLRLLSQQVYGELDLEMPDDTPDVIEPLGSLALGMSDGATQPLSDAGNGQQPAGNGQLETGNGAAPVAAGSVANTGLNGAQITSLTGLLQAVTDKQQSPAVAIELIAVSFPMISREQVKTMVDAAAAFEPANQTQDVSTQRTQSTQSGQQPATVAARSLDPSIPRSLLDQAAMAFAQLLAPVREKITALAKEIDAAGGSDEEKVATLRKRLPELLSEPTDLKRRAELVHAATMAAYASGALRTHNDLAQRAKQRKQP